MLATGLLSGRKGAAHDALDRVILDWWWVDRCGSPLRFPAPAAGIGRAEEALERDRVGCGAGLDAESTGLCVDMRIHPEQLDLAGEVGALAQGVAVTVEEFVPVVREGAGGCGVELDEHDCRW